MWDTMARQGGRVQLEQSNMRLALDMAKMAKGGSLRTAIKERAHLIKIPCADVWEEEQHGVELVGHIMVMAAIERHAAMVQENEIDSCLSCQNGTENIRQTRRRPEGTGAPPLEPALPLPGMPPAPPGNNAWAPNSEIDVMPPWYVFVQTPLPNAQLLNLDAYAKDRTCDKDCIPDLLTGERTSSS